MSTFVLVAGAGLGAWSWSRVVPLLRQDGHDVHAVTLSGTGDRAHQVSPQIDLSAWVADVVGCLQSEELTDVVLVGHSFSGTVIAGVAERVPSMISRLVYLDAMVLHSGRSVFDVMGAEVTGYLESLADEHDGWRLPWFTDDQLAQNFGDHGLSPADLLWMRRHVTAQPLALYRERMILSSAAAADLPRTYIKCSRSPALADVESTSPGWDWAEIDSGHWPMITAPAVTSEVLQSVAARPIGR